MAEAQSAFAAYQKNITAGPKKKVDNSKKSRNRSNSNSAGGAKNKANGGKVKGNASTGTGNNQTNKSTATKSPLKRNAPTKSAGQKSKDTRSSTIQEHEVDNLVEELLNESPSKQKSITKAQLAKKSELEAFLVQKVEQFDREDDSSDEDSEEEETDDEDNSKNSSFEYTLNSDVSSSDNEATENALAVNSDNENHGENSQEDVPFSLQALRSSNEKAGKRKSNNEKEINGKNASASKKTKITNESKSKNHGTTSTIVKSEKCAMCKCVLVGTKVASPKSAEDPATTPKNVVTKNTVKLEPLSPLSPIMNSVTEGKKMLQWLLQPVDVDNFFSNYWEQNACLVKRLEKSYFSNLISFEAIDQMLLQNHVEFTKNLDITSYKNGVRETLNPEGRAMPPVVWDLYGQGCSIRLLNPQTFLPYLFALNTTLQEYFNCMVGANAYLTPPNSQGFAPHYDDIEAFVLQIEGRKRWKLYAPRTKNEVLPRLSSPNFTQEEIGKPIFDEVLQPGDLLYFPRGTIHQASTEPGFHSLHITLSVYQKNSFADLFEKMVPLILQHAIATNVDMRRGLPLHTWHHAGVAFSESDTQERTEFQEKVSKLLQKTVRSMPLEHMIDAAVDQLAKKFQHEALPPQVLASDRLRTVFGSQSKTNERGECVCDYEMDLRTNIRLLRANIIRLVKEDHKLRIYYYLDNSKEYCEYEPNFIEIEKQHAASVQVLIRSYPAYVGVAQLPLPDDEQKIELATALWERGLLMTEKPFALVS